ncbi:thioesterase family protein [Deltaproteobacteria bacterium TL4]
MLTMASDPLNFDSIMEKLIKPYPVVLVQNIAWGEMDAFGHVNNIIYFRYFESVRIKYFEAINFLDLMSETRIGPILASTQCKYKIPLTYPDTLSIGAKVSDIQEDRFSMQYVVISHRFQKIAAEGQGVIVTYNYDENIKAPIPSSLRLKIEAIERHPVFNP